MRTRRWWLLSALACALPVWGASVPGSGRWEGQAQVQGEAMPLVIDLEHQAGGWVGAITMPGRRVAAVPLADVQLDAQGARFSFASAFFVPPEPKPTIALRWQGADVAQGELHIAGLVAPVTLRRSGDAQMSRPMVSTTINDALLGTWRGRYEIGGVPRDVTVVLGRDAAGRGTAAMTIVGRRRIETQFAQVLQSPGYLILQGNGADMVVEGAWRAGAIEATLIQGPFELPLVLRREGA
jgi:hypothetical protein